MKKPVLEETNHLYSMIGFTAACFKVVVPLGLSRTAQIAGGIWMVVGIAFGAWKTKGFKGNLIDFNLPPEGA